MAQPTATHSTSDARLLIRRRVVVSILYYNRRPQLLSRQPERAVPWHRVADNPLFPNADIYVLSHPVGAMNILDLYFPTLHPPYQGCGLYHGDNAETKQRVPFAWLNSANVSSARGTLPGALTRL
ncbi:hypothetical protein ARMSODRAFT_1027979 [Armillaria solidipes]|uniref:Uncharacterized protein n=1 Tax=Armillaria solidipes TaxID=1076256 RepID=A0A2H3AYD2_9AGAR|nr:hypothetical protein ARMSODRAFT_1027979 [Armillaria solidipes]